MFSLKKILSYIEIIFIWIFNYIKENYQLFINIIFFSFILSIIIIYIISIYLKKYIGNSYDNAIKILKKVNNNKYNYMNFGYWDKENMDLDNANENLCKKIIKKIKLKKNEKKKILDIGCGYGDQDIFWVNNNNCNLTAIDISKKQIDFAKNKAKNKKNLKFKLGDATELQFDDEIFDNIICLESAFHYPNRNKFFNESYRVLKKDSTMILADICLKNENFGLLNSLLISVLINVFNIPYENFISSKLYKKQLKKAGYKVKKINITKFTFKPYFKYFVTNNNLGYLDNYIFLLLKKIFIVNPFQYYIFICEK
jgi:ubiquinone/menaquinone biosynthesis C-methylase UbiE